MLEACTRAVHACAPTHPPHTHITPHTCQVVQQFPPQLIRAAQARGQQPAQAVAARTAAAAAAAGKPLPAVCWWCVWCARVLCQQGKGAHAHTYPPPHTHTQTRHNVRPPPQKAAARHLCCARTVAHVDRQCDELRHAAQATTAAAWGDGVQGLRGGGWGEQQGRLGVLLPGRAAAASDTHTVGAR
jgi:hypothetical protein